MIIYVLTLAITCPTLATEIFYAARESSSNHLVDL
jgi:hypothetical protein